jgi:hypothetical protein
MQVLAAGCFWEDDGEMVFVAWACGHVELREGFAYRFVD